MPPTLATSSLSDGRAALTRPASTFLPSAGSCSTWAVMPSTLPLTSSRLAIAASAEALSVMPPRVVLTLSSMPLSSAPRSTPPTTRDSRLVRRVARRLDRSTGGFLRRARRLLGGVRRLRRGLLGLLRRLSGGLLDRFLGGLVLVHAVAEERDHREHDQADQDAHRESPYCAPGASPWWHRAAPAARTIRARSWTRARAPIAYLGASLGRFWESGHALRSGRDRPGGRERRTSGSRPPRC